MGTRLLVSIVLVLNHVVLPQSSSSPKAPGPPHGMGHHPSHPLALAARAVLVRKAAAAAAAAAARRRRRRHHRNSDSSEQ